MDVIGELRRLFGLRDNRPGSQRIEPPATGFGHYVLGATSQMIGRKDMAGLLRSVNESPILKMVVTKIASTVAGVEWHAIKRLSNGTQQRVPGHIIERLLNNGIPTLDGWRCKSLIEQHLLLAGESVSILDFNINGEPVQRTPIPPTWITERPLPGRPFITIASPISGGIVTFPLSAVLYIKEVDPLQPYGAGIGMAASASDEITADDAAAKHTAATLSTGGVPRTIVHGSAASPMLSDDMARLESAWTSRYSGPTDQHKPFFSRVDIGVKQIASSFKDMELTQLRQHERDIIVNLFGVPPEILGIIENSNRATIESAEFLFTKHVVLPRLTAFCEAVKAQIAHAFDDTLSVGFDSPVDEDMEFRRVVMTANPHSFKVDEYRKLAGEDPLADGAGDVIPSSFQTLYLREEDLTASLDLLEPVEDRNAPGDDIDALEKAAPRLVQKAGQSNIDDAADAIDSSEPALRDILLRSTTGVASAFANQTIADFALEVAFDIRDPKVVRILEERAAESSKLITGTTRDALRKTLAEGVDIGETTEQLVARIRHVVVDATRTRARMISRTEITRASNFGTVEALDAAEIEMREWLATFDTHVRDTHARLDKQRRKKGEPFQIDGRSAMYPGDFGVAHLDINCRCGVIPVFSGDEIRNANHDDTRRKAIFKAMDNRRAPHERSLILWLEAHHLNLYGRTLAAFL